MLRNRFLVLLGLSFLAASAVLADDVGYVDCSNHSEDSPVFGKPRKTPDVLANLPCGERFTILVYGFVFSRIQTKDGRVGYIYSTLIAVDRAATSVKQTPTVQMAAEKIKIPSTPPAATIVKSNTPAPTQPTLPQPAATPAPAPSSSVPESAPQVAQSNSTSTSPGQTQLAIPELTPPPSPSPVPASTVPETRSTAPQPNLPAPVQPQTTLAQPTPAPAPATNVPEPTSTVTAQPNASAPAQPEPTPAEPAAPAIRPVNDHTTWEKPNPGARGRAPLIELYGGYAFTRLDGGAGTGTNLNGVMGSFGWNVKPWLQIVADTSYSTMTVGTTKNILYGNHFGPRYFHRSRNRWGATPFVEGLIGGSRADTTVSGTGGYTTSQNCLSYKIGGGVDIHPSRRLDVRLFDVDYYRTAFGTNLHQNNYWASAGIVLRLFGGANSE